MSITIVFENSEIVVVDKPTGMLSVPGRFADDPRPILGRILEIQLGVRLWPVHRLDFEVTGIMAFAKNAAAHKLLNAAFENKQIQKTYQAFTAVFGDERFGEKQIWESRILRGKKRSFESPHGQASETWATAVSQVATAIPGLALATEWRLEPFTGRPHQLRFEMYKHLRPIVGDLLYGSEFVVTCGIALRAVKIQWPEVLSEKFAMPATFEVTPLKL
jgi:23S rRNA-/tRNA-specific pseudouridylate synthase